jgi:hypothetical protein
MGLENEGVKNPFFSKTLHFNFAHLIVAGVWPFLPSAFRSHDWAFPAMLAWVSAANIGLRFVTKTAVTMWGRNATPKTNQV